MTRVLAEGDNRLVAGASILDPMCNTFERTGEKVELPLSPSTRIP